MFGTDEESGFEDLTYYLSKEKPPVMGWTPDCKYPVVYGERGRANLQIRADQAHLRQFFSFVTTYFLESAASGNRLGIDYHDDEYGEMQMRGYALRTEQEMSYFNLLSVILPAAAFKTYRNKYVPSLIPAVHCSCFTIMILSDLKRTVSWSERYKVHMSR